MNNENKNPNVEEELKKQSQEAAENEQMVAALSDERIQLEKQRYIYEQHIAGMNK